MWAETKRKINFPRAFLLNVKQIKIGNRRKWFQFDRPRDSELGERAVGEQSKPRNRQEIGKFSTENTLHGIGRLGSGASNGASQAERSTWFNPWDKRASSMLRNWQFTAYIDTSKL